MNNTVTYPKLPKARVSIIPDLNARDINGMPKFAHGINTLEEFAYWVKKSPDAVLAAMQEFREEALGFADDCNKLATVMETKIKESTELKELARSRQATAIVEGEKRESVSPRRSAKHERSMKLPHPPIFSDNKEVEIEEWVSAMRHKLEVNADWFPTTEFQIVYIRSRLGGDAMRHLGSRFKKNKFRSAEDIFETLEQIYGVWRS